MSRTAEEANVASLLKRISVMEQEARESGERITQLEAELKRIGEDKDYLFRANVGNDWEERLQVQERMIEMRDREIARLEAALREAGQLRKVAGDFDLCCRDHAKWQAKLRAAMSTFDAAREAIAKESQP